ncbi:phosphonoacetaldehyde reductase [Spirillospora sp. NPDC046719]
MTEPELFVGPGESDAVGAILARHRVRRPLLIATDRALRSIHADRALEGLEWRAFSAFTPNPLLGHVVEGCRVRDAWRPDAIVGVGGGSAMDVAKAVRLLPADPSLALAVLTGAGDRFAADGPPLFLVATTAGSGSEVTGFATIFHAGRKYSLDHSRVRADVAIVDPCLTASCPPEVVSSGLFDAVCHGVESHWSRRATDVSRRLAREALTLLVPHLGARVQDPPLEVRERLAAGALAAGRAIAMTRTTAAHAFAYALTIRYGIPHGVACMLNLRWLADYNLARSKGPARVTVEDSVLLLGSVTGRTGDLIAERLRRHTWPAELGGYGVAAKDLAGLVRAGMEVGDRAGNNPVDLEAGSVHEALEAVL